QQAVALAAFCVLGLTPWLSAPRAAGRGRAAAGVPATAVASGAAAVATAAVCGWALAGGHGAPALVVLASAAVLALAVREHGGVIRYASPAVAEYGYPAGSLLGTRLDELVHPEDRPGCRRAVAASLGQPGPPGRFGCRVRAADGTWRHVEATVAPYRDPGG